MATRFIPSPVYTGFGLCNLSFFCGCVCWWFPDYSPLGFHAHLNFVSLLTNQFASHSSHWYLTQKSDISSTPPLRASIAPRLLIMLSLLYLLALHAYSIFFFDQYRGPIVRNYVNSSPPSRTPFIRRATHPLYRTSFRTIPHHHWILVCLVTYAPTNDQRWWQWCRVKIHVSYMDIHPARFILEYFHWHFTYFCFWMKAQHVELKLCGASITCRLFPMLQRRHLNFRGSLSFMVLCGYVQLIPTSLMVLQHSLADGDLESCWDDSVWRAIVSAP